MIIFSVIESVGKLIMLWGIYYIFYWKNKELLLIHETYDKRPAEVFDSLRSEIIDDQLANETDDIEMENNDLNEKFMVKSHGTS